MAKKRTYKVYESHIPEIIKRQTGKIRDRLKLIKADRTQAKWSKDLKIPQQVLSRYLSGQLPHIDFLAHLSRREGVNLNWLILGKGEPYQL